MEDAGGAPCVPASSAGASPIVLLGGMYTWNGTNSPLYGLLGTYFPRCVDDWKGKVLKVTIGAVSSDYDRAVEAYFQLMGGRVDYGEKHSAAAQHARFGEDYTGRGLWPHWSQKHPVHLIGHSLGGTTAATLYQLIASDYFGVGSTHEWVKSITTIASPLRGSTLNYIMGFDYLTSHVAWYSFGRWFSSASGLFSKFSVAFPFTKTLIFDFHHPQWDNCEKNSMQAVLSLSHPFLLSTDNSAHNVTCLYRKRVNAELKYMDKVVLINVVASTSYVDSNPCIAKQNKMFRSLDCQRTARKPLFRRLYELLVTGHRFGAILGSTFWAARMCHVFGLHRLPLIGKLFATLRQVLWTFLQWLSRVSTLLSRSSSIYDRLHRVVMFLLRSYVALDIRVKFVLSCVVHYWAGIVVLSYGFRRYSQYLYPNVGESPLLLSFNWILDGLQFPQRVLQRVKFKASNWFENDGIVNTISQTWPKEIFRKYRFGTTVSHQQERQKSPSSSSSSSSSYCICDDPNAEEPYCKWCQCECFVDIDSGDFCEASEHYPASSRDRNGKQSGCVHAVRHAGGRDYKPRGEPLRRGKVYRWRVAGNHMVGTGLGAGFYRDFVFKGIFDMLHTVDDNNNRNQS